MEILDSTGEFVTRDDAMLSEPYASEAEDGKPDLVLSIVQSGHILVTQGEELLGGISLHGVSDSFKIQRRCDNLVVQCTVKGECHRMRMQFSGSSREEALKECSSATAKLRANLSVTTQADATPTPNSAPPPPNQPPAEVAAPVTKTRQAEVMGAESEVQGSVSTKYLAQHFLGERSLSLPLVDRHFSLPQGDLEPFLRVCLLDPSFPAFVEEVEEQLKKLLQD
ncbi:meiotic recombination protein REC114 [Lampris incognitus]|uniref:meiotic recombination protein REC114 n=1 Tax=Lampris incognitus TaxID=2546036 RepID=UPI0024B4EC5F|nr:meiotic recombination protein REC114 [Lampris incognitus]